MICKRLMLSSALIVTLFGYISSAITVPATTRAPRLTLQGEREFALAWDLDGVVFREQPFSAKLKSVRYVSWSVLLVAPKQIWKYDKGSMNTWRLICEQHGDTKGARYFKQMMLSKSVYKDTQDIIKRAHKKGYKLFLASNVSQDEIELQAERLPEVFNCFTDGVKVDDSPGKKALKKPSSAYFKELKRIMLEHCGPGVQFIFIDDKEENVRAARKEGFIGILCKNPAHLWKQLSAVGVRL